MSTTAPRGASYVIHSEPGADGRRRLVPYLPTLTPQPWPLRSGEAYLLVAPQGRDLNVGP